MEDFTYRTREEVEEWKTRCPIQQLRRALLDDGADEAELAQIEEEIRRSVEEAQTFAESSAHPEPASASTHVYGEAVAQP